MKAYALVFTVPAKGKEPEREARKIIDARGIKDAREDATALALLHGMTVKSVSLAYK